MQPIQAEIKVSFRYAVHFTTGLFAPHNRLLRDVAQSGERCDGHPARLLFVVDESLCAHYPLAQWAAEYCRSYSDAVRLAGAPVLLPSGEAVKNDPRHVTALHEAIHNAGLDRHSFVVAVGGGALLDVAGYAAATAHRGVRLIRVPTTTLSQNDSGVGVKNGINAFGKKNFLGSFAPPWAVLNDSDFLATLSARDWRAGIAEAVKVALIRDAAFFDILEESVPALRGRDMAAMQHLIHRCAELHLRHICGGGDPFEMGSSRPLDFGHWAAHKLEQLTDYRLRHGEAVAIGIALDATYSHLAGFLPEAEWRRVLELLSGVGFALYTPEMERHLDHAEHPRCLFRGLHEFREHLGGQLTITLLRRIGQGFEVHEVDEATMTQSIQLLRGADERVTTHRSNGTFPATPNGKGEQKWSDTPALAH
ncbi:MAG: 3-dehydroquinate synthase [Armatimonadetes bacterium]|nr:3-dehydroquinate synthase [Armatimonadota bacterium]